MKNILFLFLLLFEQVTFGQKKLPKLTSNVWKSGYSKLPFWNIEIDHASGQGYIDTFTINKTHFRIIHNDRLFDGIVQVFNTNKWTDNILFDGLGNHNDYDLSNDLNGDGHKDLIYYRKWSGEIYFFDSKLNKFSDTVNSFIGIEWKPLDDTKNIYFENEFGKLDESPVYSNLFTFKGKTRIELAKLQLNYNFEKDLALISCKLFVSKKKNAIESFKLKQKTNLEDFDLKKFWRNKLKAILGYS